MDALAKARTLGLAQSVESRPFVAESVAAQHRNMNLFPFRPAPVRRGLRTG